MARRTKKEVEQGTINIKYAPMNITGDTAFKCLNDDWGVIAFDIRRAQLENSSIQFGDKELQYNCIYFLIGRDGLTEKVYVGQAKKRNGGGYVLKRLREHANSMTEAYRNIWTRAIVVTGKDDTWGPTELNALEHIFYNSIPRENNLNGNNPNAGIEDLEQFNEKVKQIELYLATLRVGVFSGADDSEKVLVQSITNDYSTVEDLQNGMARIPEIVTPQRVVKSIIDLLPSDVWNPETAFLDPACKGGEFLKEIYNRLMEAEPLKALFPNEIARSNHILSRQIFGIALSEVSKKRTTDTLNGFGYNIKTIPNYIDRLKGRGLGSKPDGAEKTIQDILSEEFGQVKFDVVIGNPPYQETTGKPTSKGVPSGTTIYDKFVINGIAMTSRLVCMITPTKWFCGNKRLDTMRKELLHGNNIKFLHIYNASDVFPSIIMDKVCYFLYDKDYNGECEIVIHEKGNKNIITSKRKLAIEGCDCFIENNTEAAIVVKVLNKNQKSMETIISSQNPFGLISSYRGSVIETPEYTIGLHYTGYECQGDNVDYISADEVIKGHHLVKAHKVLYPHGGSTNDRIFTRVVYAAPNEVCTQSYIVVGPFSSKEICEHVMKYLKSKFVRVLIRVRKVDQNLDADRLRFTPIQDFTSNSDIDWSQSVADIDKQLYKKYGLTQEEIDYIEATIKPMQ